MLLPDGRVLSWDKRPLVMGILNVTPDSFSDGGRFHHLDQAIAQAELMIEEGADIIDIGGESSRPGFAPVSFEDEMARVKPVLQRLLKYSTVPLSIDTTKASVAKMALEEGASLINDIWGFQKDPNMAKVAADTKAGVILMHNRATSDETVSILDDVTSFFERSLDIAKQAGVADQAIMLDPGIGFGKTYRQNLQVMAGLKALQRVGFPLLLGVSRKSVIGVTLGESRPEERLFGTLAANLAGVFQGVAAIRVHDVKAHVEALTMVQVIQDAT